MFQNSTGIVLKSRSGKGASEQLPKRRRFSLSCAFTGKCENFENGSLKHVKVDKKSFEEKREKEIDEQRKNLIKCEESFKLLKRFEPTIRLLQLFGYYPQSFTTGSRPPNVPKVTLTCVLRLFTVSMIAINGALFTYNCIGMQNNLVKFGILHALTVSWIITGLKPMVNFVQLALFFVVVKDHQRLLFRLQQVEIEFYGLTKTRPNISRINLIALSLGAMSLLIPFVLRLFDIIYKEMDHEGGTLFFGHWLNTISPILVPLLTAWGVVPLIYFALLNHLVRFWFKALSKEIRKDCRLARRELSEYFRYYKMLTRTVSDFGMFNAFIGFSLAWSVICVCLAIYFVTQARSIVVLPPEVMANPGYAHVMLVSIYFNLGWSLVQIFVAILFIVTITVSGYQTNEEAIEVMMNVLAVHPSDPAKADSLQLNYFGHSISCLRTWGISLFRSFPIQRSTLLTMTSLMFTYAILLMRLSPHTNESSGERAAEKISFMPIDSNYTSTF